MDRENGSDPVAMPEQVGAASLDDRTFGSIEDAMAAFGEDDDDNAEQLDAGNPPPDDDEADAELEADAEDAEAEDEAEAVDEDEDADADEDSDADPWDAVVLSPDGEEITLREAFEGNLRMADYTQKTQALAEQRKEIEQIEQRYREGAQSLLSLYQNASQFLESLVPPEPDLSLAQQDPGAYQYQKALRESAVRELQQFMQGSQQAQSTVQQMSQQELQQMREAETAKLVEAMPTLKDPVKLKAFHDANSKFLADFGFDAEQISGVTDYRLHQLAHFARIGKRAVENRGNAQRRLAEAPRKGSKPKRAGAPMSESKKAMRRLAQTGSIQDALNINF